MASSAVVAQQRVAKLRRPGSGCVFCQDEASSGVVPHHNTVRALLDEFPVTALHHLVVPRRHVTTFFDMDPDEQRDALHLLALLKERIQHLDHTVTGFNVGMNCGPDAGQTVPHAHIHLIPRRAGDLDDPRGGVRGVIPDMRIY